MKNVQIEFEDDVMVVRIDLTKELGTSASGKSITIASSMGNVSVGRGDIKIGLNVYKPVPENQEG